MSPPDAAPWGHDPQRRRLIRALLRDLRRAAAGKGRRLTWEETADGVQLSLDGRYHSTSTRAELEAMTACIAQVLADLGRDAALPAVAQEILRRLQEGGAYANDIP
jgi:hypothetical protein